MNEPNRVNLNTATLLAGGSAATFATDTVRVF